MTRAALLFALALSSACVVDLQGECVSSADCPSGTSCVEGLCLADGLPLDPDGGTLDADAGQPATDAGQPGPDGGSPDAGGFGPTVRITAPADGALVGGTDLLVELDVVASTAPTGVALAVKRDGTPTQNFTAAPGGGTRYAVSLPLGGPAFSTGDYVLQGEASAAGRSATSAPVTLRLDRDPPLVTIDVKYPARDPGHVASGAFLRSDTVVVEASITDAPAGLARTPPVLRTAGVTDTIGIPDGAKYRFTLDARTIPFPKLDGDVPFTIVASDTLGNTSAAPGTLRLTRRAWAWTKPRALPVTAAPALAGDRLVLGDEAGFAYAIDRHTPPADGTVSGPGAWEFELGSAPHGHVAVGAARAYVVTRAGHVHALELEPNASARRAWACPPLNPDWAYQDGLALAPAGGPSLVMTSTADAGGSAEEETVLVLTRNRTVRAYRGTRFVSSFFGIPGAGCTKEQGLGIGQPIDTGAPAVDSTGAIYVGTANGLVHKLHLARDRQGLYEFTSEWGNRPFNAGNALAGPLAIARAGSNAVPAVLAATSTGAVYAIDGGGAQLWRNTQAFSAAVRGGVVADTSVAVGIEQPGSGRPGTVETRRLALSNGQSQGGPTSVPERGDDATASPVLASDGRSYVASGARLSALSADGSVEWSFDTRPTASGPVAAFVDAVTPQLSCDGVLYLVASTTTSSTVHALVTDSPSVRREGWPRAFHDPRNTGHAGAAVCP